jgi:hypothetical protein
MNRFRWMLGSSALSLILACGTDHSVLAKKPGGSGGAGAGPADAAVDGSSDAIADVALEAPVEPPGASVFTLLHAVVDAERVGFCFLPVVAGVPGVPMGMPIPAGGLAYGGAHALAGLPGFDLKADDVQPVVVAASQSDLTQHSCAYLIASATPPVLDSGLSDAAADAGVDADASAASDAGIDAAEPVPPALRALPLPVLPQKTLASGYSTLLAAAGCLGGPGLDDGSILSACGGDYRPDKPTLRPVVARLSRITSPERVSLQGVNARVVDEDVSIGSEPPDGSSLPAITFAYNVPPGAVVPKYPYVLTSQSLLGFPLGDPKLTLSPGGAITHRIGWAGALAAAGTDPVQNGRAYAVVVVGPSVNLGVVKWWNPVGAVVIPTDPSP